MRGLTSGAASDGSGYSTSRSPDPHTRSWRSSPRPTRPRPARPAPLTEEHNYWIDRVSQALVRRAALAFGDRLARDGAIASPEDVFLLYAAEVEAVLRQPSDQRALVEHHASELRRWKRLRAPKTIGTPPSPAPEGEKAPAAAVDAPDGRYLLKGAGASIGVGRGPARLVRDDGDFAKMRDGDVLVCHASTV